MAESKTTENNNKPEAFLASIQDESQREDSLKLLGIFKQATGEEPKMWGSSIVGFGSYHYKYASGREGDWMCAGFSPRKQNITVYIMSGFGEYAEASGYDPQPLLSQLGEYSTGKSCLYIKRLEDVDTDVLAKLIKGSYEYVKKTNKSA